MEQTLEAYQAGKTLLVNKPLTWTSFQAVNRIKQNLRKAFDVKKIKVGHAGTLDPLATGLLLICTGKSTKTIDELQGQEKEYTGTFRLGSTTPSFDLETAENATFPTDHITDDMIQKVIAELTGDIVQTPPIYSALQVDGERLYKKARRGEEVEIKKRNVNVREFEIERDGLDLHFRISCSKGTYIRSIANDIGSLLNSGAHLTKLCRTRIGNHKLDDAIELDRFVDDLWNAVKDDQKEV
jgi:tRNA pseudouridine55 synthase